MKSLAAPLTFTHTPLLRGCPMSGIMLDMIGVNKASVIPSYFALESPSVRSNRSRNGARQVVVTRSC